MHVLNFEIAFKNSLFVFAAIILLFILSAFAHPIPATGGIADISVTYRYFAGIALRRFRVERGVRGILDVNIDTQAGDLWIQIIDEKGREAVSVREEMKIKGSGISLELPPGSYELKMRGIGYSGSIRCQMKLS